MQLETMDPNTPMMKQFNELTGPITLINQIVVPREAREQFLVSFQKDSSLMKSQPGFIATQLHQGSADSTVFVNIAVWESTAALFAAFTKPEFQASVAEYPDGILTYPHIFEKVAVDGVCVA